MINQELLLKRLALIKLLYRNGDEQSRQAEPMSAFSILTFHDSIEMFLKLLTEHLNIKSDKFSFMDYWNAVPSLTLKESCNALNARRVNIKHKGLLPSKGDIEASRVTAREFFEQNTFGRFGISFDEISLLTLIANDSVKKHLMKAEISLVKGEMRVCLENTAIAFEVLLDEYESSKRYGFESPFQSEPLNFSSYELEQIPNNRKLLEYFGKMKKSIEHVSNATRIIGFGIDYKKYVKYKILSPHLYKDQTEWVILRHRSKLNLSKENCQFCIDFVIECSLMLQEFDFSISELFDETTL